MAAVAPIWLLPIAPPSVLGIPMPAEPAIAADPGPGPAVPLLSKPLALVQLVDSRCNVDASDASAERSWAFQLLQPPIAQTARQHAAPRR